MFKTKLPTFGWIWPCNTCVPLSWVENTYFTMKWDFCHGNIQGLRKIPKGQKVLKHFQEIKAPGESSSKQRLEALLCQRQPLRSGCLGFRARVPFSCGLVFIPPFKSCGITKKSFPTLKSKKLIIYKYKTRKGPGTQTGPVHGREYVAT